MLICYIDKVHKYDDVFRLGARMLMKWLMFPLVLTTLALLGKVEGQVNSEIDQFEDLLAVDSFDNEVKQHEMRIFHLSKNCFHFRLWFFAQDLERYFT